MTEQYVQLFSLGAAVAEEPERVASRLAEIGYHGVEPVLTTGIAPATLEMMVSMGMPEMTPSTVASLKQALEANGLAVPSCHGPLPTAETANALLDDVARLGGRYLIVAALFDPANNTLVEFNSRDQVADYAERFAVAAELAAGHGITLGYHNHFWEFGTDFDGQTGFELFYELTAPSVIAEIDLYWALAGGQDPADLVQRLGDRVHLVHVKDGDGKVGTPSVALGEGVVDLSAALAAAPKALRVVELEDLDAAAVWPALQTSYAWLDALPV